MPRKPKTPCKFPGCPNLTDGSYCTEHKQTENRRYNKYQRNQFNAKKYGKRWKQISKQYREANPLCEICSAAGRLTPAESVHHIRKVADGGTHNWDNLQALCNVCHARVHAEQGDRWG